MTDKRGGGGHGDPRDDETPFFEDMFEVLPGVALVIRDRL
jgi:hypothetical protein